MDNFKRCANNSDLAAVRVATLIEHPPVSIVRWRVSEGIEMD